jgi:hypothetical protein
MRSKNSAAQICSLIKEERNAKSEHEEGRIDGARPHLNHNTPIFRVGPTMANDDSLTTVGFAATVWKIDGKKTGGSTCLGWLSGKRLLSVRMANISLPPVSIRALECGTGPRVNKF